ncbi:MAG: hypothetical protein DRN96_00630 [Thermoproteota archaeon]|nr:MAG: hypothetical protein DRN96_00630 [Candidatus Korarchaeota archaeon]
MILITTSRRPTQRIRSFIKDLARSIPNAVKRNRGKASTEDLCIEAVARGLPRVLIVERWKGNPGMLRFILAAPRLCEQIRIAFILKGITLSREIGLKSRRKTDKRELIIAAPSNAGKESQTLCEELAFCLGEHIAVEHINISRKPEGYEEYSVLALTAWNQGWKFTFYDGETWDETGPRFTIKGVWTFGKA